MTSEPLPMWVIYRAPLDMPGVSYVARLWNVTAELQATNEIRIGVTLDGVRNQLPPGLTRMTPSDGDDPCIVEVWI